jgi:hypothetical protein
VNWRFTRWVRGNKGSLAAMPEPIAVDTFEDPQAAVTPLGQLAFFIEFLQLSGLYEPWVSHCPLTWVSPNAPRQGDVLGTVLLSVLSGHRRYAHIKGLRGDGVNPALLGMSKVVSEDSVRRAFGRLDEGRGVAWLQEHLYRISAPVLSEPWILDADVTVKPLYGHQEGAEVVYNPHKPARPTHTYHTYQVANVRLVLDGEVQSGKHAASKHSAPGLWALLKRLPRAHWPCLIRGDRAWATEGSCNEQNRKGCPMCSNCA